MKVHIDYDSFDRAPSRAVKRIAEALTYYSPEEVDFVGNCCAEVHIIFVSGMLRHLKWKTDRIKRRGKYYVLIQLCYRSTQRPESPLWEKVWNNAEFVWSYLDLPGKHNKYESPLGVDPQVFYISGEQKKYKILTNSNSYMTESARECILSSKNVGSEAVFLSPQKIENAHCVNDITDDELRSYYNQCDFVSGLRRTEGFELPAIEGLLCGARPVLFDRPHYKKWYGNLAEYIPEVNREQTIKDLTELFSKPVRRVTSEEIEEAKRIFNWGEIVRGFWDRLL